MEVILTEARESYIPEIVIELRSDKAEDLDENVDRISAWVENWIKDHPRGVTNELQTVDGEANDSDEDNEDGELVTSGEDEGSYIPDNEEDSDDALASYHESEDPATVEEGLTEQQNYDLEQKEQDDVEVLNEEDEETNEYDEHQEDVSE